MDTNTLSIMIVGCFVLLPDVERIGSALGLYPVFDNEVFWYN